MKYKLFLATALFALSTQVNAANLVLNGSFEEPVVTTQKGWDVYTTGEPNLGWSTIGAGVEIRRNNVVGSAYLGDQFAELDSHGGTDTNSSIEQALATVMDQSYLLSFAYSPRINQPESTNGISVFWNGVEIDSVTNSGIGNSDHDWTVFEYIVTGIGNDILKFTAIGTDDSLGGSLDAVSVSAVPLPAAAFLFAPALLGFMGLRRRAKNNLA
ncbi:MAG: hypothetical protein DRQ39_09890 [Gammaproteobacteria bacterium]|nr:MAG: hypothetical protein DRQ39_09890 [Gammaproteobacteria bacterium]RKZ97572.1 MAG: hypothetical protein DRQ46_04590 [Gammaproteobacteria bacterium]